jgi:hypothetical protein
MGLGIGEPEAAAGLATLTSNSSASTARMSPGSTPRFRVSRRAWGTWTDFGCSTFIRPPVGAVSTCLGAGRATTVTVCNYEETPLFADRLTSYYAITRGNQAAEDGGSTDGRALRRAARIRDDTGTRQRMRGAGRCTGSGSRWPQPRARAPGQLTASGPKAIGREQLFDH